MYINELVARTKRIAYAKEKLLQANIIACKGLSLEHTESANRTWVN